MTVVESNGGVLAASDEWACGRRDTRSAVVSRAGERVA
jgi:hypothetical protein